MGGDRWGRRVIFEVFEDFCHLRVVFLTEDGRARAIRHGGGVATCYTIKRTGHTCNN